MMMENNPDLGTVWDMADELLAKTYYGIDWASDEDHTVILYQVGDDGLVVFYPPPGRVLDL